jgi:hypothetical protein
MMVRMNVKRDVRTRREEELAWRNDVPEFVFCVKIKEIDLKKKTIPEL